MRRGPYNRYWGFPRQDYGLYGWRVSLGVTQSELADAIEESTGRFFSRQDVAKTEGGDIAIMDGEEWLAALDFLKETFGKIDYSRMLGAKPEPPCLEIVIRKTITARSIR